MRAALFLLSLWASGAAMAGEKAATRVDCVALERQATQLEADFRPPLQAKVAGKGRLYFHRAPAAACIDKKTYIIPGDALTVHMPYRGWMQVVYISRDGREYSGWVEEKRLALGAPYGQDAATSRLPRDVEDFIGRRNDCEHFIGEEPYDAERRAYLEKVIRETCTGSDQGLEALRRRYRGNATVLEALAGYQRLSE